MSTPGTPSPRLESGRWLGWYEQYGQRHSQEQTMEFADGIVRGLGDDGIGPFRIEGWYRRDGRATRLGWIKTYDGGHSVLYLGAMDGVWIHGDWDLGGGGDVFAFAPAAVVQSAEGA